MKLAKLLGLFGISIAATTTVNYQNDLEQIEDDYQQVKASCKNEKANDILRGRTSTISASVKKQELARTEKAFNIRKSGGIKKAPKLCNKI
jgi:hypothetical protein